MQEITARIAELEREVAQLRDPSSFIRQTKLHDLVLGTNGNCFAACLVNLFADLAGFDDVPQFEELMPSESWTDAFTAWCAGRDMVALHVPGHPPFPWRYIATGPSPRGPWLHSVLYEAGELLFDPHPSGAGVEHVDDVIFFASIGPSLEAERHKCWGSAAGRDVLAERHRQIEAEGWTAEHDDWHRHGQMAQAAAVYALCATGDRERDGVPNHLKLMWPPDWDHAWFKPRSRRRNLIRAAALIVAEIERLDRQDNVRERTE